jgi:hypothetical protein
MYVLPAHFNRDVCSSDADECTDHNGEDAHDSLDWLPLETLHAAIKIIGIVQPEHARQAVCIPVNLMSETCGIHDMIKFVPAGKQCSSNTDKIAEYGHCDMPLNIRESGTWDQKGRYT